MADARSAQGALAEQMDENAERNRRLREDIENPGEGLAVPLPVPLVSIAPYQIFAGAYCNCVSDWILKQLIVEWHKPSVFQGPIGGHAFESRALF